MADSDVEAIEESLRRTSKVCKILSILIKASMLIFCVLWLILSVLMFVSFFASDTGSVLIAADIILFIKYLMMGVGVAALFFIAFRVVDEVAKGKSPFTIVQVKRMRWISGIFFLFVILGAITSPDSFSMVSVGELDLLYAPEANPDINTIPINMGSLFTAAAFFCFSFVFEYGVLLQKLSDETV